MVAWTLRKSQAETPMKPKPASTEKDSLMKVKEEKEITGELDSGLNLKKEDILILDLCPTKTNQ